MVATPSEDGLNAAPGDTLSPLAHHQRPLAPRSRTAAGLLEA
jgi:hypothetical protein